MGATWPPTHFVQFLHSHHHDPEAEAGADDIRLCHCGLDPCPHDMHVHCTMPGLREQDDGSYLPGDLRSVRQVVVLQEPETFQTALRGWLGRLQGIDHRSTVLPVVVYQAKTMTLRWHNPKGRAEVQAVFHATDDYYDGPWYNVVMAKHMAPSTGPARRRREEMSQQVACAFACL